MERGSPEATLSKATILVIGGGPSGSYSAALLARDGFDVVLLEKDRFPRYHIGESLLPSIPHYLEFIDALDAMIEAGFRCKPGAAVKLNQYSMEGYTDFSTVDEKFSTWNVTRSVFDDILLRHPQVNGVRVHQEMVVTSIHVDKTQKPYAASWKSRVDGTEGVIAFDWLIDASGRAGVMSTKVLHNRVFNQGLRNVACWAYWKCGVMYAQDTDREGAPWFEALSDATGWAWYIPLQRDAISVGIVMDEEASARKKAQARSTNESWSLMDHYREQVNLAPGITRLLNDAQIASTAQSTSDYSYSVSSYGGIGYRLVGDAASFIDPFFSSGVHLAFNSALSAACSISASIKGDCSEEDAVRFHTMKCVTAYTRFLVVVLGAYSQIRTLDDSILQDVSEDGFERAFATLRPLLRGEADVGSSLTQDELKCAMDFCSALFLPTSPRMHADVARRFPPELSDKSAPIMLPEDIACKVSVHDEDALHVLREINARKPIHAMYDVAQHFAEEAIYGMVPRIGRGSLGLRSV
ncbi:FAD/NAD-P-binding domain-containing protein [Vararia minispora EC-137]|uniref:FAD/NAD-P-binding domain-containing protein n=1 Tax=Vararia minispora EC-137 TaxID=1314806 RepID=A0ACB8Q9P4_9AGAM|nr:FAD/NAD-P-binding domain-containing protein [Vararia minispora EC-137]